MLEDLAKQFGQFLGEFIEYNTKQATTTSPSYMRIRVAINVQNPLFRQKKLHWKNGGTMYALFKYERLPVFCYLCGQLGHSE